ncbi:MAG: MoxR family ATPase [Bacteroidales bacterium]
MQEIDFSKLQIKIQSIKEQISKAVVAQDEIIELIIIGILCGGHILLEGVPGVAKTLMVRALSKAISAKFTRIQFTPDMMPSDVLGTNIYDQSKAEFKLKQGPIFTDLLLADEINRTPPKTQSALLEAMEEKNVTIDGETKQLSSIFTVLATQNPLEYEGTYPLPEAQVDRFMFKLIVDYPSFESEVSILEKHHSGFTPTDLQSAGIENVCTIEEVVLMRKTIEKVRVEKLILEYITKIVRKTRENWSLILGASPRASIYILAGAKASAGINGRDFVIPDDIKKMCLPVLRHRIILKPEAEIEGITTKKIIDNILNEVEVPRNLEN